MLGELNEKQIDEVLGSERIGRIGCYDEGKVYIVPVTYIYYDNSIIAHSASGLKIKMMRDNPEVCFEVEQIGDMQNWKTVIVRGIYEELDGEDAGTAYNKLFESIRGLKKSETLPDKNISPVKREKSEKAEVIYRIKIKEKNETKEIGDYQHVTHVIRVV